MKKEDELKELVKRRLRRTRFEQRQSEMRMLPQHGSGTTLAERFLPS